MPTNLKDFLAVDKEQELLQSFIRVGVQGGNESLDDSTDYKNGKHRHRCQLFESKSLSSRTVRGGVSKSKKAIEAAEKVIRGTRMEAELRAAGRKADEQLLKRRKPKDEFVDFYTDKDRAAAVSAGAHDIKQSLQIKQKQDRSNILRNHEETDINSLIALGLKEIKNLNPESALNFFNKALELSANDLNALISRSKCYLLLGNADKALADAETALTCEPNNIRAIHQKAESLYHLGQFEQSLMYFHRALRARPEFATFRLGIQKNQEAIENTIGEKKKSSYELSKSQGNLSQKTSTITSAKPAKVKFERLNSRKLLGELFIDKEYLENLLRHPHLVSVDTNTDSISPHAKAAIDFLNQRQEFWRQQRPCTALSNFHNLSPTTMPKWF